MGKADYQREYPTFTGQDMELLDQVIVMHHKFQLDAEASPSQLTDDEKAFRALAMHEEVSEYQEATTLADQLDALVDLQVFLLGTVHRHGFEHIFEKAFNRVMQANMKKVMAQSAEQSKRGFKRDLIKPKGWTAPDLRDLVGEL
ncbi:MAG: nucleoside triphosphate pyrophosphohydrolase family protein [Bacteroidia bacterium]